jgi:hypothetical protein
MGSLAHPLDIQDRVNEVAGCCRFGAEPRSDLNALGIKCGEALDHAVEHDSAVMCKRMYRAYGALQEGHGYYNIN